MRLQLTEWYNQNKRDLPWRHTRDPYLIWLSEIVLQQTRVQQGLPYYEKFAETFPTVRDLAAAPEQEVLRLWQGLGYYSRARNLHSCAKTVLEQYEGIFPDNYKELLKLKGVGPYTAAAIASFAFKEAVPVVDGNVFRVLARLFGITSDISQPSVYKEFRSLALSFMDPGQPDIFNQAIMEFGAMHCTPQKPLCLYCPLKKECYAFKHYMQKELPVKKARIKIKHRYFHYFIICSDDEKIIMKRRESKDIWNGLYDFYLVEKEKFYSPDGIKDEVLQQLLAKNCILVNESCGYRHQLTHQRLHVKFFVVKADKKALKEIMKSHPEFELYSLQEAEALPKPVLIKNYLENPAF